MANVRGLPVGLPEQDEIGTGDALVSVRGRVVDVSTIGRGAEVTTEGVHYVCNTDQTSDLAPVTNVALTRPNCSASPRFAAVDAGAQATRRIFVGGILGALAATVLVEGLFFSQVKPEVAMPQELPDRFWERM